jgi:hypothetical protein
MNSRTCARMGRMMRIPLLILAIIGSVFVLGAGLPAPAADDAKATGMGRLESATGTLLRREGADKGWQAVPKGGAVPDTALLLALPGVDATIKTPSGAIRLTLHGNAPQLSPTPALESAIALRRSSDYDLDAILDRGRVVVENTKEKGTANVRLRARDEIWEVTLKEPGAAFSAELNGRWAPGMPYRTQYKEGEEPKAEMALLVLKGTIELKVDDVQRVFRAPPAGPALFFWDSVVGVVPNPVSPAELPPWAKPDADKAPADVAVQEVLKPLIERLANKPPAGAIADFLASAEKASGQGKADLIRELAVRAFGAVDDLPGLFKALGNETNGIERAVAVETLRHWIGRKPGQDATLGRFLVRDQKYTPEHAATVLQLLHSYGQKSIEDPVTYEVLIAYLQHDKLPIRELAAFQLYRLAPVGEGIRYDPAAPAEKREQAVKAWKKLIPTGELPPTPKPKRN